MALSRPARVLLFAALTGLPIACGGGGGDTGPTVRTPSAVDLVSGGNQAGTAGGPLPAPVTFRVGDARGPLAGVRVRFTVEQGGGNVSPAVVETGADGLASATWQVGIRAGELSVLRASVEGTSLGAAAAAQVVPAPASALRVAEGGGQFAPIGQALPVAPAVQVTDQFGNAVPGTNVSFAVAEGGGTLGSPLAVSDAEGIARAGTWVLGPAGGLNVLRATLAGIATVDIQAIGTAAALRKVSGDGQSAHTGRPVGAPLVVRAVDANEQPVAGISVAFVVASGGGQLTGTGSMTGPDGLAVLSGWTLGLTPGENVVQATSLGVAPVSFIATGVEPVASTIEQAPLSQTDAFVNNVIAGPVEVRVLDAQGVPILGRQVQWSVSSGGGMLIGSPVVLTDTDGRATLPGWQLGPIVGIQSLAATVEGLPPAVFTVTTQAPPPSAYDIVIRYQGETPAIEYQQAVDSAAKVWRRAILGDLPDVPVNTGAIGSLCGAVNEVVDDIIMFVRIEQIDGEFGVLGSAGPCVWRASSSLPLVGGMRLDVADVARLHQSGQLVAVIIHEMGHILGFGTRWTPLNLLVGAGTADPLFTGPAARTVFESFRLGGLGYEGAAVPVENVGGAGSVGSHWRESVLRNELLTSLLNSGPNPLTALSLAGFRDMGYLMDDAAGEPYTIPSVLFGLPGTGGRPRPVTRFAEVVRHVGVAVDATGRIVATVGLP